MLCPQSAGVLSNAVTCRESQIYHVKRKKTETKEYIAYDSINERPELTPGRRHQKVVSCGLREGNEFTGGGGAGWGTRGNFLGDGNVLYLDLDSSYMRYTSTKLFELYS